MKRRVAIAVAVAAIALSSLACDDSDVLRDAGNAPRVLTTTGQKIDECPDGYTAQQTGAGTICHYKGGD